ncbi:MAG: trigger factor [Gammaproteobacteria bacterium]|jgi:trigger factor|nr:trigger factor [Gammaproteobacteria bacterium]
MERVEVSDVQVTVESVQGLKRRIRVSVPAQRVEHEVETRLRSVARTANIKGYRPGKVPEKVVRQRFSEQVRQDVMQDMVRSSYSEAVTREKLRPVGDAQIETTPGSGSKDSDLSFTASFEVFPDFQLQGIDALSVTRPEPQFDDADVAFIIDNLRRQRRTWNPVEREAHDGDRVTLDFEGRLDGEPIEGGAGDQVSVVIGAGRLVPDFERQLAGVRAGEQKTIQVVFPADYPNKTLAGRQGEFDLRISEVAEEKLPDVDEEFIRSFGVESGERADFEKDIRANMAREFESRARSEVKKQLLDLLLNHNPIDVPEVLVAETAVSLQGEAARNLGLRDGEGAPPVDTYRPAAERRVRLSLLLGAIIMEQGMVANRDRVSERIDQMVSNYDKPDEVRKIYYQNAGLLGQIEDMVLEDQVIEWLTQRATVTQKPTSFQALVSS